MVFVPFHSSVYLPKLTSGPSPYYVPQSWIIYDEFTLSQSDLASKVPPCSAWSSVSKSCNYPSLFSFETQTRLCVDDALPYSSRWIKHCFVEPWVISDLHNSTQKPIQEREVGGFKWWDTGFFGFLVYVFVFLR